MDAITVMKARLLDLATGILEMARDGNRDMEQVCEALQIIKEERDFAGVLFVPVVLPVTEGEARAIEILGSDKVLTIAQAHAVWPSVEIPSDIRILYSEDTLRQCAEENTGNKADWRLIYVHGLSLREQAEKIKENPKVKCGFGKSEYWLHEKEEREKRWVDSKFLPSYYLVNLRGRFAYTSWVKQEREIFELGRLFERANETMISEVILSVFKTRRERLLKDWGHWGYYSRSFAPDHHVYVGFSSTNNHTLQFPYSGGGSDDLMVCLLRKFDF